MSSHEQSMVPTSPRWYSACPPCRLCQAPRRARGGAPASRGATPGRGATAASAPTRTPASAGPGPRSAPARRGSSAAASCRAAASPAPPPVHATQGVPAERRGQADSLRLRRAKIRPGDATILDANAKWLTANPRYLLLVEGHCDPRGTNEYNLALGDRRAKATMDYLVAQGIPATGSRRSRTARSSRSAPRPQSPAGRRIAVPSSRSRSARAMNHPA